ncbi:MAG: RNA polymerase sigma factor [Dehalococcoidia bacterium]|nr:RNA polymerase sigma factor [Dehalococcoidia bacterium]
MDNDIIQAEIALVHHAKMGDREAFGQLMENHAPRAYRLAFTILQNQSDAEDVVQEAFITAYKSISKLEKEGSFVSWLSRIVTTRAYDLLRKKHRNNKTIEESTSQFKMELSQGITNRRETSHDFDLDLREAIKRLPETHRVVVMLRYSEDATTDEIAVTLNRPAGTIRRILSESYGLLRLYLQRDDNP